MRCRVVGVLLLFLVAAVALSSFAQETTGTITGFVKDSTGAVIPNVQVIVRNTGTGLERRLMTGAAGEYTATLLPVGSYEVAVEHAGFRKFLATGIALNVNDRLRIDVNLRVGATTEEVTVEAAVPLVQTESSAVGAVVRGEQVRQTPLNGRSLYQLLALQPGVTAGSNLLSGRVGYGLDATSSVSVNGMRFAQNNWLIDGGDNVDTGSNLGLINYVSIDAISEFRILRGNYSAEFGRSGGGQINVVTRSGNNGFHGSAYEFLRNDVFDARPYFKPSCASLQAQGGRVLKHTNCDSNLLRYNDFGGTFGGPIIKNKLFFFFGEEVRRVKQVRGSGVINTRVPTDLEKAGDFSQTFDAKGNLIVITDPVTRLPYAGNKLPAIDPNAQALLGLWPAPNATPALLGGVNNYTVSTPASRNYREEVLRVDWNINSKHTIFVRGMQDNIPSVEPFNEVFGTSNADLPGIYSDRTVIPAKNIVGEWNWIATPNFVNNFAFNYSKGAIFTNFTGAALRAKFPAFTSPEIYPLNPAGALPAITITGYAGWGGNSGGPFAPYFNTYGSHRIKETAAWNKGKHALKFGYLFSWEFKNEDNGGSAATAGAFSFPSASSGGYVSTGSAFANFLLGRATSYTESDIDMFSELTYHMHEAYLQDDWKVLPNLTLNLGARWSYILPPVDKKDRLTNFVPALFDPTKAMQIDASGNRIPGSGDPLNGIIVAGQNSPWGRAVTESHANTIGPRVGFAWDPWKDGKTSFRGGYGVYFDRTLSGIALQNAFVNPPFVNQANFTAANATTLPTLANPQGGNQRNNAQLVPTLLAMSPDFKIPTTQQWSLGLQRELPLGMTMDIAYVGNHATHLLREVRINQTQPGAATSATAARSIVKYRGYASIRVRDTSASSRYDALQFSLNRKMSKGLQYGMAYTWGKTITDSPDDRSTVPQSLFNLKAERALASFDKSHVFIFNWMYQLPFFKNASKFMYNVLGGWEFDGLVRAETGTPLSFFTSGDPSNSFFGGSERLNVIADPNGQRTKLQWFNTAAFAFPSANQFGNSSRSIVRGPGLWLTDVSFNKNFKFTERVGLQFRADMFNALNHTNWNAVNTTADANFFIPGKATNTPQFGQVTSAFAPREIQLGMRLTF